VRAVGMPKGMSERRAVRAGAAADTGNSTGDGVTVGQMMASAAGDASPTLTLGNVGMRKPPANIKVRTGGSSR